MVCYSYKMVLEFLLTIIVVLPHCLCREERMQPGQANINAIRATTESSWIFVDEDDTDIKEAFDVATKIIDYINKGRLDNDEFMEKKNARLVDTTIKPDDDPCSRKSPQMPDYNVPGRRISEVKCDEYIWDMLHRDEINKIEDDCIKHKQELGLIPLSPPSVVGGKTAKPGEFPHMGALGWRATNGDWRFNCGCSLISSKFFLTAAHCSSASPRDTTLADIKPKIVRFGVQNINYIPADVYPYEITIYQIIVHPEYRSPKKYHDIALVELTENIRFSNYVQPACLWTRFDTSFLGHRAIATGWGYVDLANREAASFLQSAELDIINSKQCDALLRPSWNRLFSGIKTHQLCAGVLSGGVDTCQGDSGGPLQVKIPLTVTTGGTMSYLIGVTSFGSGCARENSPGVYTRVSSFIDWIEHIVWPHSYDG